MGRDAGIAEPSGLITQIVGGLVSGAVGFWAASILARRQRRWDAQDAAAAVRAALIQSARVPLAIIQDEIRANQAYYYTPDIEERVRHALREAIYGLRDESLIQEYEKAIIPLRNLAFSGNERASYGEQCKPLIEAMLKRLADLEAEKGRH